MKLKEIPPRFIGFNLLMFFILLISTIFLVIFASKDNIFLWLYISVPFIWLSTGMCLSRYYNILARLGKYYLLFTWFIMLIIISILWLRIDSTATDKIVFNYALQYATVISGFPGLLFGYFIAVLKTKIKPIDPVIIEPNTISFNINENNKDVQAIKKIFVNLIMDNLGYGYHSEIGENSETLRKTGYSDIEYIFISYDENNISFFPFIKDGYYIEPNNKELPLIHIIGDNILKLKSGDNSSKLFSDFDILHSPNTFLKNIRKFNDINIKLNKKEIFLVGIVILLVFSLVLFLIQPQYKGVDILVILPSLLAVISIIVGVIDLVKGKKNS